MKNVYEIVGIRWNPEPTYYDWDIGKLYRHFRPADSCLIQITSGSARDAYLWVLTYMPQYAIGCQVRKKITNGRNEIQNVGPTIDSFVNCNNGNFDIEMFVRMEKMRLIKDMGGCNNEVSEPRSRRRIAKRVS